MRGRGGEGDEARKRSAPADIQLVGPVHPRQRHVFFFGGRPRSVEGSTQRLDGGRRFALEVTSRGHSGGNAAAEKKDAADAGKKEKKRAG